MFIINIWGELILLLVEYSDFFLLSGIINVCCCAWFGNKKLMEKSGSEPVGEVRYCFKAHQSGRECTFTSWLVKLTLLLLNAIDLLECDGVGFGEEEQLFHHMDRLRLSRNSWRTTELTSLGCSLCSFPKAFGDHHCVGVFWKYFKMYGSWGGREDKWRKQKLLPVPHLPVYLRGAALSQTHKFSQQIYSWFIFICQIL